MAGFMVARAMERDGVLKKVAAQHRVAVVQAVATGAMVQQEVKMALMAHMARRYLKPWGTH